MTSSQTDVTTSTTQATPPPQAPRGGWLTRQKPMMLTRIAFWAFVVACLGGVGGAIAIWIGTGAPSRDILTTTIVMFVGAVVLATRLRVAPIVAALLGAYNLTLVFFEPYAVESLAIPKGPNGGYGHFVGVVVACAVSLIAFGASAAATVQLFRAPASGAAPRWLPAALSAVGGLLVGALFIGAMAQPPLPAGGGTVFTNGVPTVYMGAGNFVESSVTIPRGSKLLIVDNSSALHILVNGNWENGVAHPGREASAPVVDNVHVSGNSVLIGPFATVGTYHIYCIIHPGMNLTVNVE